MTRAELTAAFWALPEADRTAFLAGVQAHMRAERRAADPARTAAKRAADADRQAKKRAARARDARPSMSVEVAPPSGACPSTDNAATRDGLGDGQATDLSPAPLSSEGEGEETSSVSAEPSLSLSTATSPPRAVVTSVGVRLLSGGRSTSESATDIAPDWIRVGRAYAERWEAATDEAFMSLAANQRALDAIATECRTHAARRGVSFDDAVDALLAGVFADAWMRENSYPLAAVEKNPAKYRQAAKAAPRGPRRPVAHDHPSLAAIDDSDAGVEKALGGGR